VNGFNALYARGEQIPTALLPVPETESIYLRDISIDPTTLIDAKLELDEDRVKEIEAHAYKGTK
jgi:hypothetical protein